MHNRLNILSACGLLCGLAACAPALDHAAIDEAELRSIHASILQAHLDRDPEAWTDLETDTVLVGSRGEVFHADRESRLDMRRSYLGATRFHRYADLRPPIVRVAGDRSIGWVVAEVGIAGVQENAQGGLDSLAGQWAWIETYERVNGRWRMSGNVSTEKP